jgi:hypothetical protein
MTRLDKSVLSFISTMTDFDDVDVRIEEHHGEKWFIVYVDLSRFDINGPNYDPNYYYKITDNDRVKDHPIPGLMGYKSALSSRLREVKKFFGDDIEYNTAFLPKNYDYLKKIEKKIDSVVKSIDPDFRLELTYDQDRPTPIFKAHLGKKYSNYKQLKDFWDPIKEILKPEIDMRNYSIAMTPQ